jgi:hypothetical protein
VGETYRLSWIDDERLKQAVSNVYTAMQQAMANSTLDDLQASVIDPFSLLFETTATKMTTEDWVKAETQRQVQKSWMNQVGYFHQDILGAVDGWVDLGRGDETEIDIKKEDESIFAEIKNKYNTQNKNAEISTRRTLEGLAQMYPDAEFYLVHIIRGTAYPYNKTWKRSGFETHPRIKKISGEAFYSLVTGSATALHDLYQVIPAVMQDIIAENQVLSLSDSTAMSELRQKAREPTEEGFREFFFKQAYRNSNL